MKNQINLLLMKLKLAFLPQITPQENLSELQLALMSKVKAALDSGQYEWDEAKFDSKGEFEFEATIKLNDEIELLVAGFGMKNKIYLFNHFEAHNIIVEGSSKACWQMVSDFFETKYREELNQQSLRRAQNSSDRIASILR